MAKKSGRRKGGSKGTMTSHTPKAGVTKSPRILGNGGKTK